MFASCATSQNLASDNVKINWTVDIVLGSSYTTTQTFTVGNSNFLFATIQ